MIQDQSGTSLLERAKSILLRPREEWSVIEGEAASIGKIDGRLTNIRYDSASKDGRYGMIVGERFNVQADGYADSVEDLRAAVNRIDIDALEAVARSGE